MITRHTLAVTTASAALSLSAAAIAFAHAHLIRATPAEGGNRQRRAGRSHAQIQ